MGEDIPLGVKLIGLPLLLLAGLVTTAFLNDPTYSGEVVLYVLRWLILLIAAPLYTFGGALALLAMFCCCVWFAHYDPSSEVFWNVLAGFRITGYIWVGAKVCWYIKEAVNEHKWREEARIRKAAEEERMKKEEQAAQREFEEERAVTYTENKELVNQAVELVSSAGSKAVEMMRVAKAIGGRTVEVLTPERLFLTGVLQILSVFSEANGGASNYFATLIHGMLWRLEPTTRVRVNDCIGLIERQHSAVSVPMMVLCLATYDQTQGTKLSTQAASIYCSVVQTASNLCGHSVAANLVASKYIELLRPYIRPAPGNENAANSSSSDRTSSGGSVGKCPNCAKYYAVLGLNGNATEAEVKQAKRDLAKVWHPDRFSENDARLRCMADERLKDINGAYAHISKHWEPSR